MTAAMASPPASLRHGDFDVGLVLHLFGRRDPALVDVVSRALDAISPGARIDTFEEADQVSDEILEALGVTAAIVGELETAIGARKGGQCRRYLLTPQGEILRERFPSEAARCDFGCAAGAGAACLAERAHYAPIVSTTIRTWKLCGGIDRRTWPRAGGLEDQDAATVYFFEILDGHQRRALEKAIATRAGGAGPVGVASVAGVAGATQAASLAEARPCS